MLGLGAGACIAMTTGGAGATESAPATSKQVARTCHVRSDGKLLCENKRGAPLYQHRSTGSRIVDYLDTSPSVFACWGEGDLHAGGNRIWYWTNGDRTKQWGNIPAVHLYTSVDPPAGMKKC
ncbi:hypothetical protein ABZ801_35475 [Actinomadura sp. NPDC047616]